MKKKEEFDAKFYGSATVETKGQIVIPAKLRKYFNIKQGDTDVHRLAKRGRIWGNETRNTVTHTKEVRKVAEANRKN
jgi:AbrB family looped-hinge helix DNA binding protein